MKTTKLSIIRHNRNISQSELSRMTGIPKKTIQYFEQSVGSIDTTKLKTLCILASALDCTIIELLEDDELIKYYDSVR